MMTDTLTPTKKKPATVRAEIKKPRARPTVPTGAPVGRPYKKHLDLTRPSEEVPRLIITGRGQLNNRAMHALRLPTDLINRLKSVASGPTYLLVQIAIDRLCTDLENSEQITVVKAEDLG